MAEPKKSFGERSLLLLTELVFRHRAWFGWPHLVLSAVCVIEIGIKHAAGRLKLKSSPDRFVDELTAEGSLVLDVSVGHALRMASLPLHHQDPFDRLLVAQAQIEGLTIVSADPNVLSYDVAAIDARK